MARAAFWAVRSWGTMQTLDEAYKELIRHTGPALSPFSAWVLLKGLETLELRVMRQSATAATLAEHVAAHRRGQPHLLSGPKRPSPGR